MAPEQFSFGFEDKKGEEEAKEEIVPKREVSPEVEAKVEMMRRDKQFEHLWKNEDAMYQIAETTVRHENKGKKDIEFHGRSSE
jgi:hypothetical protein